MARLTRRTFLKMASGIPLAAWFERYWGRLFCLIDVSSGTGEDSLLSAKVPVSDSGGGSEAAPVWSGLPSSLNLLQGLSVSAAYASGPLSSGAITYSIAPGSSQSVAQLAAIGVSLSTDGFFSATPSARLGTVVGLQVRATNSVQGLFTDSPLFSLTVSAHQVQAGPFSIQVQHRRIPDSRGGVNVIQRFGVVGGVEVGVGGYAGTPGDGKQWSWAKTGTRWYRLCGDSNTHPDPEIMYGNEAGTGTHAEHINSFDLSDDDSWYLRDAALRAAHT